MRQTFACRYASFKFEFMPLGLMNAPSTFMIDFIFRDFPFVRVHRYDFIMFSDSTSWHVSHLLHAFQVIAKSGLKLKIENLHSCNLRRGHLEI